MNESSAFQLFLMGKFTLIYECFGLQARFLNGLCSQSKDLLYVEINVVCEMVYVFSCVVSNHI